MSQTIETLCQAFAFPKSCYLGKRISKKLLLNNEGLKASDKKLITEDIDRLYWQYTLKPDTLNIAAYQTDEVDYGEIAVLSLSLKQAKRSKRLIGLLQRLIPYPLLLLVSYKEKVKISTALKRKNLVDSQKLTIEYAFETDWIEATSQYHWQGDFYQSLHCKHYSWDNFYRFYLAIIERILAYQRAVIAENYLLNQTSLSKKQVLLQQKAIMDYYQLATQIETLAKQAKKTRQIGKQVELNTRIHRLKHQLQQQKLSQ